MKKKLSLFGLILITSISLSKVNAQCSANFHFYGSYCNKQTVNFEDSSNIKLFSIKDTVDLEIWTYGDGNIDTFYNTNARRYNKQHIYKDWGTFVVTLYILTTNGCTNTSSQIITIQPTPKAGLSFLQENDTSKTIQFTDFSNPVSGSITNWYWDFGDGDTAMTINPSHTYKSLGVYAVKHFVKNGNGCFSDTAIVLCYLDSAKSSGSTLFQSNMGTDFWAGFGYEERMKNNQGTQSVFMSISLATGNQPATVTVSLPGISGAVGFPKVITIPSNSFYEVTDFPIGPNSSDVNNNAMLPDARLYFTGITNRGIHITSTAPVAAWERVYASNNSAGATLLIPTNVWGNDYIVQTMGGLTNTGIPNAYFFVIAKEDSTDITFTPSNNIIDSSTSSLFSLTPTNIKYYAGVTYKVRLNKGQVFNAMGYVQGTKPGGVDLSGTHITSSDPTKKIAVFGGNGRLVINISTCSNTTGSDNLIQQMFPRVAWGNKYLTTPTKTMEYGIHRITVYDTSAIVKVNGNILPISSLLKSSYYQIEGNTPNCIESDKNIMVTQYITTSGCPNNTLGNNGSGDPEMIILSPVANKINNTTVYISPFANGASGGAYANIVIKKNDIGSFRIDGSNMVDTGTSSFAIVNVYGSSSLIPAASAFKIHPGDTSYCYGIFKLKDSVSHILSSDSGFIAIAYGMASGESWGYNAGFRLNYPHVTYTFAGKGNWSDPINWVDNLMPPRDTLTAGTEVVISGDCILDTPETIEDGATLTVVSGGYLTVNGNLIIKN